MSHVRKLSTLGLALLMLFALTSLAFAQGATPSVTVSDQPIKDDTVTIAKVVSNGPGWLVVHADKNGAPGPVLGETAVADGENTNVVVKLATEGRTETLYAMLHTDAGTVGAYEFPGDDKPVSVDGKVITPAFKVASEQPTTLPTTGGVAVPWAGALLLAVGGLALVGGFGLALARRRR